MTRKVEEPPRLEAAQEDVTLRSSVAQVVLLML
jgi:hypothetical protein